MAFNGVQKGGIKVGTVYSSLFGNLTQLTYVFSTIFFSFFNLKKRKKKKGARCFENLWVGRVWANKPLFCCWPNQLTGIP